MFRNLPTWALEMAGASDTDEFQPSEIDGINLALNRARLARFLAEWAQDGDVQSLLALDALGAAAGLPLSSTGLAETVPSLALRPFRLWEYTWLYRTLNLSAGEVRVLDLGGPSTHLTMLAALVGCRVTTLDINAEFAAAARECAKALGTVSLDVRVGDMRDLSVFPDESFDAVVCCSVLEHLTGDDQKIALREMARVLRAGGVIGLTFDFGRSAGGANIHLPPPHDPPPSAAEALRRFAQKPLAPVGNRFEEDPIPGSLFHNASILYTVASMFLAKPPTPTLLVPKPEQVKSLMLGATRIADMPYRFYQTASGLQKLLGLGEAFRIAADERLASLLDKEKVIRELDAALRETRAHVERATHDLEKQARRLSFLEQRRP